MCFGRTIEIVFSWNSIRKYHKKWLNQCMKFVRHARLEWCAINSDMASVRIHGIHIHIHLVSIQNRSICSCGARAFEQLGIIVGVFTSYSLQLYANESNILSHPDRVSVWLCVCAREWETVQLLCKSYIKPMIQTPSRCSYVRLKMWTEQRVKRSE